MFSSRTVPKIIILNTFIPQRILDSHTTYILCSSYPYTLPSRILLILHPSSCPEQESGDVALQVCGISLDLNWQTSSTDKKQQCTSCCSACPRSCWSVMYCVTVWISVARWEMLYHTRVLEWWCHGENYRMQVVMCHFNPHTFFICQYNFCFCSDTKNMVSISIETSKCKQHFEIIQLKNSPPSPQSHSSETHKLALPDYIKPPGRVPVCKTVDTFFWASQPLQNDLLLYGPLFSVFCEHSTSLSTPTIPNNLMSCM